jgi:hypothetical protein
MKPLFSIDYLYNKDSIIKVSKFYNKKSIFSWVIPVLVAIFVGIMTLTSGNYIITFFTILFGFFILNYMTKKSEEEINVYLKSIEYLEKNKYKLNFYSTYFEEESKLTYNKVNYKNVFEIAETRNDYLIFVSSIQAYVISKDNIKDQEAFHKFMSKFKQYKYYKHIK